MKCLLIKKSVLCQTLELIIINPNLLIHMILSPVVFLLLVILHLILHFSCITHTSPAASSPASLTAASPALLAAAASFPAVTWR